MTRHRPPWRGSAASTFSQHAWPDRRCVPDDPPFLLCLGAPDLATMLAHRGLPVALFLAGLAGSVIHCLGMCGPFVLGQAADQADLTGNRPFGELQRLRQAALLPYHLGRLTTYSGLGALFGAAGAMIFLNPLMRVAGALLLFTAALILLAQILPKLAIIIPQFSRYPGWSRIVAGLANREGGPGPKGFFALWRFGVLLGFLPCGFLWGALAVAASSGGALQGLAAMAGFAFGTMPSLIGLAWGGSLLARRWQTALRRLAVPLQGVNALFLLWVSARLFSGL